MASIQTKRINGAGPYAYRVEYVGNGEHRWEYLGKANETDVGNINAEEPTNEPEPVDVGKLTVADMPPAPCDIPPIENLSVDELVTLSRLMAESDRNEWDDEHDLLERAIHEWIREEVDVDDLEERIRDAEEAGVLDPQGERHADADGPDLVDDRDRQGQLEVGDAASRTSDREGQSTQGASERFADDRDDRHLEEEYQDAKLTRETEEIDGQQSLSGGEASVDKEPEWQD
ncbi:hypothetical protein PNP85_10100 [Halobacterium salinarum]|uniref:hypothetical protein n=1 Tax=Halobacterium TaxID=2239 RepID=UPI0025569FC1|nr:hypothetical protein [Halobacterium salinarum]MDL0128176.1 hypothetical protein [Halobacterium salinarum]MDL0139854.1 hypothetical protein [Halobacterium salinarum]